MPHTLVLSLYNLDFPRPLCHVRHSLTGPAEGGSVASDQQFPGACPPSSSNMAEARKQEVKLDSTLDSVDVAEEMVKRFAEQTGFSEDDIHQIGMAVRESVVNAVVHGNCYSAHKKVTLALEAQKNRLTIRVQDQGVGFDLGEVPDPLAEENLLRKSGRGLFLIRAFMDELHVHRLGSEGMEVIMVKNFSPNISKEDGK